jgi:uncharacterized membrane protein YeaQ/YmgE (transglycosylase-associated protein family)
MIILGIVGAVVLLYCLLAINPREDD